MAKKTGTTKITAKVGKKKYTFKLKIQIKGPALSSNDKTLYIGESYTLKLYNGSAKKWRISNKKVATLKKISKNQYKITAKKTGTTFITVQVSNRESLVCEVTVKEKPKPATQKDVNESVKSAPSSCKEIFDLINKERTSAGLNLLLYDSKLSSVAQTRAKESATKWSHTRPNGEVWFWLLSDRKIKYTSSVSEILSKDWDTSELAVYGWMHSVGHKAKILGKNFTRMGIGYYNDGKSNYWCVIFDGTPD